MEGHRNPENILEPNRLILDELEHEIKGKIEDEASVQGQVGIGEKSVVKRGAIIRGPVAMGENTMVEAHTR